MCDWYWLRRARAAAIQPPAPPEDPEPARIRSQFGRPPSWRIAPRGHIVTTPSHLVAPCRSHTPRPCRPSCRSRTPPPPYHPPCRSHTRALATRVWAHSLVCPPPRLHPPRRRLHDPPATHHPASHSISLEAQPASLRCALASPRHPHAAPGRAPLTLPSALLVGGPPLAGVVPVVWGPWLAGVVPVVWGPRLAGVVPVVGEARIRLACPARVASPTYRPPSCRGTLP